MDDEAVGGVCVCAKGSTNWQIFVCAYRVTFFRVHPPNNITQKLSFLIKIKQSESKIPKDKESSGEKWRAAGRARTRATMLHDEDIKTFLTCSLRYVLSV